MFSSSRLKLFFIICCEKNLFLKKTFKSITVIKKAFENIIFKIIQVIFNEY